MEDHLLSAALDSRVTYTDSYLPYLETVFITRDLRTRLALLTGDPFNMGLGTVRGSGH